MFCSMPVRIRTSCQSRSCEETEPKTSQTMRNRSMEVMGPGKRLCIKQAVRWIIHLTLILRMSFASQKGEVTPSSSSRGLYLAAKLPSTEKRAGASSRLPSSRADGGSVKQEPVQMHRSSLMLLNTCCSSKFLSSKCRVNSL